MNEFEVECLFRDCNNQSKIALKFLELSQSTKTCTTLRDLNCIPLIVSIIYSDSDEDTRQCAFMALQNVVEASPHDETRQMEVNILRHIESILEFCDFLTGVYNQCESVAEGSDRHPLHSIYSLMKISFNEDHRRVMCQFGSLQTIANLFHLDHVVHGHDSTNEHCLSLRRCACMALTNLTFNDSGNKALLCSNREFMKALVAQFSSTADDLLRVTAGVLRNLSWGADNNMKTLLNEIGSITALSKAAMKSKNENTLNALLSVLWNLSAHSSSNKSELCAVNGMLAFLVDMLTFEGSSKTLTIIKNAGGILRNVSSNISDNESYRKIVRERNCLSVLLKHISSKNLSIVSNAVGVLWNLSEGCPEDQRFLLDNEAISMLNLLTNSENRIISSGSCAVIKNLLNFRHNFTDKTVPTLQSSITLSTATSLSNLECKDFDKIQIASTDASRMKVIEQESMELVDSNVIAKSIPTPAYQKDNLDMLSKFSLRHIIINHLDKGYQNLPYTISYIQLANVRPMDLDLWTTKSVTDPPDKRCRHCEES